MHDDDADAPVTGLQAFLTVQNSQTPIGLRAFCVRRSSAGVFPRASQRLIESYYPQRLTTVTESPDLAMN